MPEKSVRFFPRSSLFHSFLQFILVFLFVRSDPDPYHSGFVYSQAIGVSEGLLPARNFLSPYGIVGPIINGLWLYFTNTSLLSLLTLYALFIVIIGNIIRIETKKLVSNQIALLLSYVWILTLASAMPWPSILTTLQILLGSLLLRRALITSATLRLLARLQMLFAVLLINTAALTRIHLILAPILLSTFLFIKRKNVDSDFLRMWLFSNLLSLFLLLGFMVRFGVLSPFVDQVIVWPATAFESPAINTSFVVSFIWFPFALCLFVLLWMVDILFFRTGKTWGTAFGFALNSSVLGITYLISIYDFKSANTATLHTFAGLLKNATINMQFSICYFFGMVSILSLVRLISKNYWKSQNQVPIEIAFTDAIMIVLCLLGWVQLYPFHDNVHLWFVTPLFIIPALHFVTRIEFGLSVINGSIRRVLICILIVQLASLSVYLHRDRVPLHSRELIGMQASPEYQAATDKTLLLLDRIVKARTLRNNCKASLYAVSDRKFRSIDGNFSGNFFGNLTQYVPIVDPSESTPTYIFECELKSNQIDAYLNDGYEVVFRVSIPNSGGSGESYSNVLFRPIGRKAG